MTPPEAFGSAVFRSAVNFSLLLSVSTSMSFKAVAQDVPRVVIPDRVQCTSCRIVVGELRMTFGGSSNSIITSPGALTWDKRGRLYVTQSDLFELPLVFDSTGRVLARVGAKGAGPGELKRARAIAVMRGDSILVLDPVNARMSLFDPNYKFIRSFPIPAGSLTAIWNSHADQIVLNVNANQRTSVGLAFAVYDRLGSLRSTFGRSDAVILPTASSREIRRVLFSDEAPSFLAALVYRHEIEVWSSTGVLERLYVREAPWFPVDAWSVPYSPGKVASPRPYTQALHRDSEGLVWSLVRIPDRNWKIDPTVTDAGRTPERGTTSASQFNDTMIEVLSLAEGRVLARLQIDSACIGFSPWGDIVCGEENPDGSSRLEFRRILFRR